MIELNIIGKITVIIVLGLILVVIISIKNHDDF